MQFRILGPPDLHDENGDRSVPLNAPKTRLLIGALLAQPNFPVPRSLLIRELWGATPPRQAAHTLNAHVSTLRKSLLRLEPEGAEGQRLSAREAGYALRAAPAETDAGRFRAAVAAARRTAERDPGTTCTGLRAALALWRGDVLGGGTRGPVCTPLAARLERERQEALEIYFDCALRTGRHQQVVPELEAAVAAHPLRERFHDQLMLALCRCGRGPEAIGVYRRARRRLAVLDGAATPLLTARLEQISVCSPVLTDPGAAAPERAAPRPGTGAAQEPEEPSALSVAGYLTQLLSGRVLAS
ncbi:AfsR/SARP family transcriptional regulator [Streptomyces sp. PsTaAH-124]|uniref:AfsR/SARP family transcriptional regulator n=2 Tax=unclassified Streptomyces TaxID=2593676 RepID=UPI00035E9A76|nr:BTAD domain-containing putative transcriptional regulator [Streptomyces sp. PsTaAH-124]